MNRADVAQRFRKLALSTLVFLAAGLLYALFVTLTGLSVPCIFRTVTHLKCPGCGMTSLCLSLLRLDFHGAWEANPAALLISPLGAAVAADMGIRYVLTGDSKPDLFSNISMALMSAVLIVFGVLRNIV